MSGPFGKLQNVGQAAALKTIGMAVKMEGSPTILFKVALRAYIFFFFLLVPLFMSVTLF